MSPLPGLCPVPSFRTSVRRDLRVPNLPFLFVALMAMLAAVAGIARAQNVGASSGTLTAVVKITATGTASKINVLTLGAANLDFKFVSGGTCSATGTYNTLGATCTVEYTFTPSYPGVRYGGVTLTTSAGTVIGETHLVGTGTGPQVAFAIATGNQPSTAINGFGYANGTAIDGSGNFYVTDGTNNAVYEVPSSCTSSSCFVTLGGGFSNPVGIAIDGIGNLYIADDGNSAVREMPTSCTSASCVTTLGGGFTNPWGVAVDGSGNVYVSDFNASKVFELAPGCGSSSCVTTLGGGFDYPTGIAVDGSGNVFVANNYYQANTVQKMTPNCYSSSCVTTIGGGFSLPNGLAVDGTGNVYIADGQNGGIKEMSPSCISASCVNKLVNISANGLVLDGPGNVYATDYSEIVKADLHDPPSIYFNSTPYGYTSTDSPEKITVFNNGNVTLSVTGLNIPVMFSASTGTGYCTASSQVSVYSNCMLGMSFSPTGSGSGGYISSNFILSDNNLNSTTSQSIPVGGQALSDAPTVTNISPGYGTIAGGTTITITGTLFSNATSVKFGSAAAASFTVNNATSITAKTPVGAVGSTVDVTVTTSYGTSVTSSADQFTYFIPASSAPAATVGTTSVTQTAVLNITTTGTASAINVLTKGVANTEFKFVSGGTCSATGTYNTVGATCTVQYTFTPAYPGIRYGGITLTTSSGTVLAQTFVTGTGNGPQAAFTPSSGAAPTVMGGTFSYPASIAMDGSGDVYVADNVRTVLKVPTNCTSSSCVQTLGGGFNYPQAIAVDGSGNIYVADYYGNAVSELPPTCASASCVTKLGGTFNFGPRSIAVDGSGNVYVNSVSSGNIYEMPSGCLSSTCVTLLSGFYAPEGVAIDGSGNLYTVAGSTPVLQERPAGCTSNSCTVTLAGGTAFYGGATVSVDSLGNVYVTSDGTINEVPPNCLTTSCVITVNNNLTNFFNSFNVAPIIATVDGTGNIYILSGGNFDLYRVDYYDPPTFAFNTTNVGSTSSDSPKGTVVSNDGNANLSITGLSSSDSDFVLTGSTCTATTTLVSGSGSCLLDASFEPYSGNSFTGNINIIDNTAAGKNQVPVSGTGIIGTTPQTITFPQPATVAVNTSITLIAYSTSGLPITYSIISGSATLSGSILTATGIGSIVVQANQIGSGSYAAASAVRDTVTTVLQTATVGTTSSTFTSLVTISAAGTVGAVNVLTRGATNGDYSYVSGGTCATGASYTLGQTCTVQYTVKSSRPGISLGAVSLTSNASTPVTMGTAFLSATGVGPLAIFPSATLTATTIATGFYAPSGVAVDGYGDVFVADTVYGLVKKIVAVNGIVPANPTIISLPQPSPALNDPGGVAVDGNGDVFVTDYGNNKVWEYVSVNGTIPASPTIVQVGSGSSFTGPESIAVDGNGDVFVGDFSTNGVKEILSTNGVLSSTASPIGSGFNAVFGVAVDGSGDVFVSDAGNNAVKEIVAVNGTIPASPQIVTLGSGIGAPIGIAVDAAGDVFVYTTTGTAPVNGFTLNEIVAVNGTIPATPTILPISSNIGSRSGIAVDNSGHLFIADNQHYVVKEIDLTTPATMSFSTTAGTSVTNTTVLQNAGNANLVFSQQPALVAAAGSGYFTLDPTGTTLPCSSSTPLAESGLCNVALAFAPQGGGTFTGDINLLNNSLNGTGVEQQVPFVATALTGSTAQTITFPQPPTPVAYYAGESVTLAATSSAGTGHAITYTVSGPASLNGAVLTYTGTGTVVVTANQAGDATYAPATASVSIHVVTLSVITWNPSSTSGFNNVPIGSGVLDASSTTGGSFAYTATLLPSGSRTVITASSALAAGSYSFTVNFTPTDITDYSSGSVTIPFSVTQQSIFLVSPSGSVASFFESGGMQSGATSGGGIGAAADASGYIWSINANGSGVSKFTDAGALSASYSGLSGATALAIDGSSNIWITNSNGTLSTLSNAGTVIATITGSTTTAPSSVAIDLSGNVWVSNPTTNTLDEVIGGASPAAPLSSAVTSVTPGVRP